MADGENDRDVSTSELVEILLAARMSKEDIARHLDISVDELERAHSEAIRTKGARAIGPIAVAMYGKAMKGDKEALDLIAEMHDHDPQSWPKLVGLDKK